MKFDQYAQQANQFIKEVARELGEPENTDHAYRITRAVLHSVRSVISPEESLHLISQLPMFLKAVYVDSWRIHVKDRIRSMDEFIECLLLQNPQTAVADFGNDKKAIGKTKAVLHVLMRHVSPGEIEDIVYQFPKELRDLWIIQKMQPI